MQNLSFHFIFFSFGCGNSKWNWHWGLDQSFEGLFGILNWVVCGLLADLNPDPDLQLLQ
jgi:hypothetical protein